MKLLLLVEEPHLASIAVIYDDSGRVLLGKATNNDDRKGKWCFPAGHAEDGECPGETATREAFEETGFEVKPQGHSQLCNWRTGVTYVVCRKTGGCANPNNEFTELNWFSPAEVWGLKDVYSGVLKILEKPAAGFP